MISLLNIAGGIALVLFGVRFLRKGFSRMFGRDLRGWLDRVAARPTRAAVAGCAFGTLAPSSTAQIVVTLQLLRAGTLPIESTLVFLLAANAGISVTVQLIALRLFDYFAIFLVLGLAGFQALRSDRWRGAAQAMLGLGFIFLAMSLISEAARQLSTVPDFRTLLTMVEDRSVLITFFAAIFTVLCQSSTASVGLALGLTATGQLTLGLVLPIVLGANLGIGITALIAGYTSVEGRWLGMMNLAVKLLLVVPALMALPVVISWVQVTPGDLGRQAANFHTAFGVVALLISLVAARPIGAFLRQRLALEEAGTPTLGQSPSHLDPEALKSPRLALANATRETLRMGDEVKSMLENAWRAFTTSNAELARTVRKHDDQIDQTHAAIKRYLGQLSPETMDARDQHLQFGLMNFASQLEVIADLIAQPLSRVVDKTDAPLAMCSEPDQAVLRDFYAQVHARFQTALAVLATRDKDLAAEFLASGDEVKARCVAAQKEHYQRLENLADSNVLAASGRFIDVLNSLRRISGLLNTIGHTFVLEPWQSSPPSTLGFTNPSPIRRHKARSNRAVETPHTD